MPNPLTWCLAQQSAALAHMRPHVCDHPHCTPEGCLRWMADVVAEEVLIRLEDRSTGEPQCTGISNKGAMSFSPAHDSRGNGSCAQKYRKKHNHFAVFGDRILLAGPRSVGSTPRTLCTTVRRRDAMHTISILRHHRRISISKVSACFCEVAL